MLLAGAEICITVREHSVERGHAILPKNRPLLSYYANSISHLLGPFAEGVRERDALPSVAGLAHQRAFE